MATTTKTSPDTVLAYSRVLRLTDRLLDVAQELREARDQLQTTAQAATTNSATEGHDG